MSHTIKSGSTDQYAEVKVWTTADGLPKTDITNGTAGLSIKYQLDNGTVGTLSAVSMSAGGSHADGGIYHIGNGRYKIGMSDAMVSAVGKQTVWIELTDTDSAPDEIRIVAYDSEDSTRLGVSALPNAAADAAGGLPISDAGGLDMDGLSTNVGSILTDTGTTLPATLATAQADLDTITGADGATLASTQSAITFGAITVSVTGATSNITLAGSGSGDAIAYTRSGSGSAFDAAYETAYKAELLDSVATAADILTTALTESYAADGSAPTLTQALLLILQHLSESSISSTTKTVKQLDGSTTAATFTLDDASAPTSITRAS